MTLGDTIARYHSAMESGRPEAPAIVLTGGVDGVIIWSGRRSESFCGSRSWLQAVLCGAHWPILEMARSTLLDPVQLALHRDTPSRVATWRSQCHDGRLQCHYFRQEVTEQLQTPLKPRLSSTTVEDPCSNVSIMGYTAAF